MERRVNSNIGEAAPLPRRANSSRFMKGRK
jgi:hypothetical protein